MTVILGGHLKNNLMRSVVILGEHLHWYDVLLLEMLPLGDICDILNTNILKESCMATSIRLNHEIEQRLDRLSAETGRTKAFYLRELIERGLEDLEDYYLGMEVLERLRKGEEHTVSLDEAEKELGLDD